MAEPAGKVDYRFHPRLAADSCDQPAPERVVLVSFVKDIADREAPGDGGLGQPAVVLLDDLSGGWHVRLKNLPQTARSVFCVDDAGPDIAGIFIKLPGAHLGHRPRHVVTKYLGDDLLLNLG